MLRMIKGTSEVAESALASPYCAAWKPRTAQKTVGSVKACPLAANVDEDWFRGLI